MENFRDLLLFVGGGAAGCMVAAGYYAVTELRKLRREVSELRNRPATTPASILEQAQAEARNRQLAILAAVDMADYVAQNFDGASTEIIKRIAPHLLKDRVG